MTMPSTQGSFTMHSGALTKEKTLNEFTFSVNPPIFLSIGHELRLLHFITHGMWYYL